MATTVKRKSAAHFNAVQTFTEFLALKTDSERLKTRAETLKKRIKEWLPGASEAYTNENGSVFYDLPETVEVGGTAYRGMELRRSVSTSFNEEEAEKILKRKGVYDEALSTYVDQDKVYRLVQEEKITEKDLDKMFSESESFAFWPVKGEVL